MIDWRLTPKDRREIREKLRPIVEPLLQEKPTPFDPFSIILPLSDILEESGKHSWLVGRLRELEIELIDRLKKRQ